MDNPADDFVPDKFLSTYLNIVPETFYFHDPEQMFFSEKIFKPIFALQPFIIIGQPGSLKQLRKFGYKTFSPLIDESYDEEIDDTKRLPMAAEEIKRIVNMNDDEISDFMIDALPILEHNYKHLRARMKIMLPELHENLLKLMKRGE
ncbi:MAG: hypothetical protein R2827_15785 [Bdellovibrionales bacterium]